MALVAAALATSFALVAAETQAPAATSCDAALVRPEFHFPREMRPEDGSRAFAYGADATPFLTVDGATITFTLTLTFDPDEDSTIKLSALDADCSGGNSSGAVFEYTFTELKGRVNAISYSSGAGIVSFNGQTQKTVPIGTPRYVWIEAWDGGEAATARNGYSYLVDLLQPETPVSH
jgi:hypothetical protein